VQPLKGEEDHRSLWHPPIIVEGHKVSQPSFEVWKTKWPDDGSLLALCSIELYFAKDRPSFPFPYWLEVKSPHYTFKMRAIDSGSNLVSPMSGTMPRRCPRILGSTQKGTEYWKLAVQIPVYFQQIHLFALDLSGENKVTIPIPFTFENTNKKEEKVLVVATSDLTTLFQSGHRYRWILIPQSSFSISVESEEVFTWTPTAFQ
jgi:hypothetical protein